MRSARRASRLSDALQRNLDPFLGHGCVCVGGSGIAGEEVGQNEVTLFSIGEGIRGKGDLRQVDQ